MRSSTIRKAFIIAGLLFIVQYAGFKIMRPAMIEPGFMYLFMGINFGIILGIAIVAIIGRLNGSIAK